MTNRIESNGHKRPAVTGQKIQNTDGSVEYRVTLKKRVVGVFATDIGVVGITRVDLDSQEPRVTVDCTRNLELQGDQDFYWDKRDVFIDPGTQTGYDKISSNTVLSVDVGGITNGHREDVVFSADSKSYGRI